MTALPLVMALNLHYLRVFAANNERLRALLLRAIEAAPQDRACPCASMGAGAVGAI